MPAQPIAATTQDYLNLADISNDLVLLKDGGAALVLQTSAVNFGLLSEPEQDAIIYAYAALLNSLTFPIQILIRSQTKDISQYQEFLHRQQEKTSQASRRQQIDRYRQFVESLIKEGNLLDKKFYVVIPFSRLELGVGSTATSLLKTLKPKTASAQLPFPKDYILTRAQTSLEPKRDHLIRQFNRLGLRTHQLTTPELVELFFNLYNPDAAGTTKLTDTKDYTQPLVQPAIQNPPQPSPQPPTTTSASPTAPRLPNAAKF